MQILNFMRWIAVAVLAAGAACADERKPRSGEAAPLVVERGVSELRLRGQAHAAGPAITFGDVLDFSAADPRLEAELAGRPLVEGFGGTVEVTHEQVVEQLETLGVNLARVLVVGEYRCRVQVSGEGRVALASDVEAGGREGILGPAAADHEEFGGRAEEGSPGSADVAGSGIPSRTDAPLFRRTPDGQAAVLTLADHVRQHVQQEWADAGGTPELAFERGRDEFLSLTSPPFEFSVRSGHGEKLGLREFKVTIYRDGRLHRTVSVFARVSVVREVLVAARPLNIGSFIRPDSIVFARRMFETDEDLGLSDPQTVVGQAVQQFVSEGQMLRRGDLKAVDMVQRSRPVTVYSDGAVHVRLSGTALDEGGLGDIVRVRIGEGRNSRRIVRGQVAGVARVKMLEGE